MTDETSPLKARLDQLGISASELAAIVSRDVSEVETWIDGGKVDRDARVLLRILDDEHAAALAVERVRLQQTVPLQGDEAARLGIDPLVAPARATGGA